MKTLANLLSSLIIATWVVAIALLSIQNFQKIPLNLLVFSTLELPLGIVLAFSFGIGLVGGALAPLLWRKPKASPKKRSLPKDKRRNALDERDPLENW